MLQEVHDTSDGPVPDKSDEYSQSACDMDSMHVLPLHIIPLQTPSLQRAKLIKNVSLDTSIELYSDSDAGRGLVEIEDLATMFEWPKSKKHPDEQLLTALSDLHSFDVYSLRIQLRALGIEREQVKDLQLSSHRQAELMKFMNEFTQPLLRQIYDTAADDLESMDDLVKQFSAPDQEVALTNLKRMANKLQIELETVPRFLEDYADIYMSIASGKECLNALIPQIFAFEASTEDFKESQQFSSDARLMRGVDFIRYTLTDVMASVVTRFESFERASETMWENITAESFLKVKNMVRDHHVLVGAILCALTVKMKGWEENLAKGGGLSRRADFIRSEMMQGMEKISSIEETVKRQQQASPTWEAFRKKPG